MVMPSEPIRDIMRRTMLNLAYIEERAQGDGPFEVTQLINSFLGALAHPWEALQTDLMAIPLADALARGWPNITKERPTDRDPNSLGDLVRLMRNSFAHGNITFLPGPKGEIQSLRVWNTLSHGGPRTWGTIITVADARLFLVRFAELAEEIHTRRSTTTPRTA
ncbi:hypothetical protein FE840_007850 [Peteryoungia desertarenae]|uniref:pEK499-p136 HEPN domain-containing protein n=1 Tax=Peteryoungia desertarenae TaxID=1813451 RepID=A0ABX6QLN6_9HYPH|nr:HEPN family nuclease [Peteryoungia desertarenae]QLF69463.1 hypothetical protein FE840_007850 [Peteryoungia desertarenae]